MITMPTLNALLDQVTILLSYPPLQLITTVAIAGSVGIGLIGFAVSLIGRAFFHR